MGRQFRLYLLPIDTDDLLSELKREHGLRIVAPTSANAGYVEAPSTTSNYARIAAGDMFFFGQHLLAPAAESKITMSYNDRQTNWLVDFGRSEVIEFSTCDYGAGLLREGRFYYQKNMLSSSGDAVLPKSTEFITWAERIFRTAKKHLQYSRELEAYVGREADSWRRQGGKFIAFFEHRNAPFTGTRH